MRTGSDLYLAVPAGQWMHYGERELRWIAPMCCTAITGEVIPDITRAIMVAAIIPGTSYGYDRPFNRLNLPLIALMALARLPYY